MLSNDELKRALQKELSRADKVLLVLFSSDQPMKSADIKAKAKQAGCNMSTWNIADILKRAKNITIRVPSGFEIGEKGHAQLQELGISKMSPAAAKVAHSLRQHLEKISNPTTKAFAEEAIKCFEAELYRSAIVMSWLTAVGVLQNEVIANRLTDFNAEAKRVDPKWKAATTADDLSRMKEVDFLDRLSAISVIGKNVKTELISALNLRNGCGHPNSLKVGQNAVAHHIETLLLNVFEKFNA